MMGLERLIVDFLLIFTTPDALNAALRDPQTVAVLVNGRVIGEVSLSQDWDVYEVVIPAAALAGGIAQVDLQHAHLESPYDASGGASSDRRRLAAAYAWLRFEAQ